MYGNNNPFGGGRGQRNVNPNAISPFQLQRNAQMTSQQQQQTPFRMSPFGQGPGSLSGAPLHQQEVFGANFGTSSFSFGSPNPFNTNANRSQRPEMSFGSNPPPPPPLLSSRFPGAFGSRYNFNVASNGNRPMFLTSPSSVAQTPPLFPGGSTVPPSPPHPTSSPPNYHSHSHSQDNSASPPSYESALFSQAKVYEKRFSSNSPSGNVFGTTPQTTSDNRSRFKYVANRETERQKAVEETKSSQPSSSRDPRTKSSKERNEKEETKESSESSKKPVVRRAVESGPLFARAVAGVAPRTSSKEEKSKNETATTRRRMSERRGSTSDGSRLSAEEIERLTSIVVREVPSSINNKRFLMQHFGKYGIVKRISCMTRKGMAIIHFSDHVGAENAKTNGTRLQSNKPEALIFWGRMVAGNSRYGTKSQDVVGSSRVSSVTRRDVLPKSPRREKNVLDDDVEAELQSMGQSDILNVPKVLERPKNVEVPSLVSKPVKSRVSQVPAQITDSGNDSGLLNKQSFTSAEKFQTLVSKDKQLRQKLKKPADLANAVAVVGTCPDMCPEKERYMREERGQLHPYEIATGNEKTGDNPRVNHRKAVKEYSRSSADQEEPLPHELRPPQILARTMDYIVCNILDILETSKGSGSAAEWYDFVWNRTRAIRKDITQQHLCDLTSVALVEKCARFHIHCAERLCEEDMSAFDQKINNENLTKCLQTLKHFYADLEIKGECCPNEAEFRAYDILLNLNEGDTLREAQCFRPEIRQSEFVRFALSVFSAINSNNYVAFFKHVRRASYLGACVLQRYFTQVRLRSMKVLFKAYCPPNRSGQFPMAKFMEMLAFEDSTEVQEFLDYHGVSVEFGQIILDKAGFLYPDNPVPVRRAHNLIESKRICSVGEVVNGGSLPPNPLHAYDPYNSFDTQGFLVKDVASDDRETSSSSSKRQITEPSVSTVDCRDAREGGDDQEDRFLEFQLDKAIEGMATDLVSEVVEKEVQNIGHFIMQFVQMFKVMAPELLYSLLLGVTSEMIRDVAVSSLNESKVEVLRIRMQKEEAERERRIRAKRVADEYVTSRVESIVDEVVSDEIRRMSTDVFESELAEEKDLCIQRCSDDVSSRFATNWSTEFIAALCAQVYNEEKEHRRKILDRVSQKISRWRAFVFFRKWQNIVAKHRRMKHTMEAFPSTNLKGPSRSFTEPWVGSRSTGLLSPIQIASNQLQINSLLNVSVHCSRLQDSMKNRPLDILRIIRNHFTGRYTYWKVVVSMATDTRTDTFAPEFARFLKAKLKDDPIEKVSQYSSPYVETLNVKTCTIGNNLVGVCIKAFYGRFDTAVQMQLLRETGELVGTRGIVMLLQQPPPFEASHTMVEFHWNDEYDRLANLLCCKPSQPPVPVLILCPWHRKSGEIESGLRLSSLVYNGLISVLNIVDVEREAIEPVSTIHLREGIEWLAQCCPQPPNLVIEDLCTFVDNCITKHFSPVAYRAIRSGSSFSQLHPPLNALIEEYNHVIEQAANIVSSQQLKDVSWPPAEFSHIYDSRLPEFGWNSEERLSSVVHSTLCYRLPILRDNFPNCKTGKHVTRLVWDYIDKLVYRAPKDVGCGSKIVLVSRTQKLLDRTLDDLQFYDSTVNVCDRIPWTDLIHIFIHYMLQVSGIAVTVVYDPKLAQEFTVSKQWEAVIGDMCERVHRPRLFLSASSSPGFDVTLQTSDQLENLLKRKVTEDPFEQRSREKELKRNYSELSRQLSIEKQRNAEYDDYLEKIVTGGNSLQSSTFF